MAREHALPRRLAVAAAVLPYLARVACGFVDPTLQPLHLFDQHKVVLGGVVTAVDEGASSFTVRVTAVVKGVFTPKEFTVIVEYANDAEADEFAEDIDLMAEVLEGETVVAFLGGGPRRLRSSFNIYIGDWWHKGRLVDPADPSTWRIVKTLGDGMAGTFKGNADCLLRLTEDMRDGTAFFPAVPIVRFRDDVVIAKLEGTPGGVALYDLDDDGAADVLACSDAGVRAYLQTSPLTFEDGTAALGLAGVAGTSCGVADVDGDGRADVLVGATVCVWRNGHFTKAYELPGKTRASLKVASFAEIDGDGRPDIVASTVGPDAGGSAGGLGVFINTGDGIFEDRARALGLTRAENGAGLTGYFAPGDFNADGRTDLFYGAGEGFLLMQGADGTYAARRHDLRMDFRSSSQFTPGAAGAGCMASLVSPEHVEIVAPGDNGLYLVAERDGALADISDVTNELRIAGANQVATLAEDLNMDGYVDAFTICRTLGAACVFHTNRGYASFMKADLYAQAAFPGEAYHAGATGLAAGDVDGDGDNDLVLLGVDGTLTLMASDVLERRRPKEFPTYHERKALETALVHVRVAGDRGVLGARVDLADATGALRARRWIGHQVLTGCRGPDTVELAVRSTGPHVLRVRFADGEQRSWDVDLEPGSRTTLVANRAGRDSNGIPPAGAATGNDAGHDAGASGAVYGTIAFAAALLAAGAGLLAHRRGGSRRTG